MTGRQKVVMLLEHLYSLNVCCHDDDRCGRAGTMVTDYSQPIKGQHQDRVLILSVSHILRVFVWAMTSQDDRYH